MKRAISKTDFYTQQAKKENYPSRSVYKLKEIDKRFGLFKKGDSVLDLGCSPGSWLLYIAEKVGGNGKVLGVDVEDIRITLKPNVVFLKTDILKPEVFSLKELKEKYDAVVSDSSPKTSGIKARDAATSLLLAEKALEIAKKVLVQGGNFVCKVFEGENSEKFLRETAKNFRVVKKFKPKAVIKGSREFYCVGISINSDTKKGGRGKLVFPV